MPWRLTSRPSGQELFHKKVLYQLLYNFELQYSLQLPAISSLYQKCSFGNTFVIFYTASSLSSSHSQCIHIYRALVYTFWAGNRLKLRRVTKSTLGDLLASAFYIINDVALHQKRSSLLFVMGDRQHLLIRGPYSTPFFRLSFCDFFSTKVLLPNSNWFSFRWTSEIG